MSDIDLAWRVEEACLNACPSPREVLLRDRWLVRIAGGNTRRVNAVNPLRAEAYDPTQIIDAARRLCQTHGRPLVFRAPTIAEGLDARLARAGLTVSAPVSTLVGGLAAGTDDPGVEIAREPSEAWLAAKFRMTPKVGAVPDAFCRMIGAILLPKAFAALVHEGSIAAVAYGAVHEASLVIEAVVTDLATRRRGFGRRIVGTLMEWARAEGATMACLQVASDNAPAVALYRGLGFETDLYRYRYFSET